VWGSRAWCEHLCAVHVCVPKLAQNKHTHTRTHTRTRARTDACTHTGTHANKHACTAYRCTHAHAHTHSTHLSPKRRPSVSGACLCPTGPLPSPVRWVLGQGGLLSPTPSVCVCLRACVCGCVCSVVQQLSCQPQQQLFAPAAACSCQITKRPAWPAPPLVGQLHNPSPTLPNSPP